MSDSAPDTFLSLASDLARVGAAGACAAEAARLDARTAGEPRLRAEAITRAARGLRVAARLLEPLARPERALGFRPVGLRGAIAAGHLALVAGRTAQAELVGAGAAEAAPDSPAGLRLVGAALFAQGRFALAVRAYRGALAAAPEDPFTLAVHAEALWFAGERVAARCVLASLRGAAAPDPLAAALHDAVRSGALAPAASPRRAP